jgi:hypothetical protein
VRIKVDLLFGLLCVWAGAEMILGAVRQEIAAGDWRQFLADWEDER